MIQYRSTLDEELVPELNPTNMHLIPRPKRPERKSFRQWISNGGKMDIAARAAAIIAILLFIASLFGWGNGGEEEPFEPLNYVLPQVVHDPNVDPDAVEDEFRPGEIVPVFATKCIDGGTVEFEINGEIIQRPEVFVVEGTSYWIRIAEGPRELIPYRSGSPPREAGCHDQQYANQLPEDIGPGVWRLEGQETVRRAEHVYSAVWYTEPFRILPPGE